ncbi:MAG TPA: hypothetical protein VKU03_07835 [Roseiarcus sp.]|nr:hypothetical protein [Roseiarcus sp.]
MIKAGSKRAAVAAALAVTLAVVGSAPSPAAAASAKHNKKPQAKADSGPTVAVTITNKRKSGVVELDVALAGSPAFKPLLKNLAPGKQAVVTLAHDENCAFDFYVKYDDGEISTVPNVHVCDDGKLNLVE